jgi:hypothetical protein
MNGMGEGATGIKHGIARTQRRNLVSLDTPRRSRSNGCLNHCFAQKLLSKRAINCRINHEQIPTVPRLFTPRALHDTRAAAA